MAIQRISFTTLQYRNLDSLGDTLVFNDQSGLRSSILPRDRNFYAIVGDGDARFEAGETAYKLSDMDLLSDRLEPRPGSVTGGIATGPVAIRGFAFGGDSWQPTFSDLGFGLSRSSGDVVSNRFLSPGESLSFVTHDPLASVSFTVSKLPFFKQQLSLDVDGQASFSDNGFPGDSFPIRLSDISNGDSVSMDLALHTISVNGAPVGPAIASASSIRGFFSAFEASNHHRITVGSSGFTALRDVVLGVDAPVGNQPVGPITDTDGAANAVLEGSVRQPGTAVGITLVAVDPNSGDRVSYTLDDTRFYVDTGGVVRVAQGAAFDYESAEREVSLGVTASSTDGSSSAARFVIGVRDASEFRVGPIADTDPAPNQVREDAILVWQATGDASVLCAGIVAFAEDLDGSNNIVTYSLTDDGAGRFAIDAATGEINITEVVDVTADTIVGLTVLARSLDGSESTADFETTILAVKRPVGPINDVDDTPNRISRDAATGTATGLTLLAVDPDAEDTVSYVLTDPRFTVDVNGAVRVSGAGSFDGENAIQLGMTAVSSDGSQSEPTSFTIDVTDALMI